MTVLAAQQSVRQPEPGVSETLAVARAHRISDVHYTVALRIPSSREERVSGTETISFALTDANTPVILDFAPDKAGRLEGIRIGGNALTAEQVNGHIAIPATAIHTGVNQVELTFEAGDTPLNRSSDFLYTIFVPARAHEAFPCFDQPDLKARWTLSLDVPDDWQVLANGAESARSSAGGRTVVHFDETQPIPTYLFAFAAGKFFVETAERNGRTFRMFHRETDAAKVARNKDAIFDLHAAALEWLERYTGIPYPFGKFDFLLVPSFQFGGMEHPGAIFYNASGLLLDPSATQNELLGRASVISHETTHMWFGDLVTMRWFTDVWMKEVFANYMAAKIVNPSFPGINHELRFLLSYYPSAYDVDRTAGSNAIRQPLANLAEAGTLYGAIIYQKAPIVMRQLETLVGSEAFRDGLREYLRRYSYSNASWTDLISLLDSRTPEDLAEWSHAWVDEPGRPVISTELQVTNGKIARLAFVQRDPISARGLTWTERMQVAIGREGSVTSVPVELNGGRAEVPAAVGMAAPEFVLPNGGGIAYGEFHLDPHSRDWLLHHVPEIADALTRGAAWVTLWDAMLDGEAQPADLVSLALQALPREKDEQNVQRILGYSTQAYWKFLSPDARQRVGAPLERAFRAGLAAAPTASLKGAWFNALRDLASSADTLGWLTNVWSEREQVPGLVLSETDYIRLAEELAVREPADADRILNEQAARIKNPDRKAQFAFVRPAISADAATRDAWFASLANPANRRREPWVLEGLRYLHHPLRAASAVHYIAPSLDMLQEIQRTGDIFFPKRWMDATLGGHQSASAAAIVRGFLDRVPPAYPDRLRRIILSSADDLFRAASMTGDTRPSGRGN
ncbi:MAG TPA: M1 family aminopeptidase [Vicinamibacterales bacterium]|nr:M1 family aminopeptidase [Vicinamibacterales bacterium]